VREEAIMSPWEMINETVVKPLKEHTVLAIIALGVLFYVLGASEASWLKPHYSDHAARAGLAIFGAGVCAAIMRSNQFLRIFQENLHSMLSDPKQRFNQQLQENLLAVLCKPGEEFTRHLRDNLLEVIYNPPGMADNKQCQDKWEMLTKLLLSRLLLEQSEAATAAIVKSLMAKRQSYYLDDFQTKYRLKIDDNTITVTNSMCADVHLAPDCNNHVFSQTIESDAAAELISFTLDNRKVEPVQERRRRGDGQQGEELTITVNLEQHLQPGQKTIRLERVYQTVQSLRTEPFISATISRFIKGAVIRTRVSQGYRVRLIANGIEKCDPIPEPDGGGFIRWDLAKPNVLLLPGQGYTLIIIAN
jgi:hypothetical protein